MDSNISTQEAVAVRGNHIAAVGRNQDVLSLAGPNTLVIDLKGRTIVPGLIDTHTHVHSYAERAYGGLLEKAQHANYRIDWRGVRNKDDVLNQIKTIMDRCQFAPGE